MFGFSHYPSCESNQALSLKWVWLYLFTPVHMTTSQLPRSNVDPVKYGFLISACMTILLSTSLSVLFEHMSGVLISQCFLASK